MSVRRWLMLLAVFSVLPMLVWAQGVTVPYGTSKIVWDAPAPSDAVLHHTIKCGTVEGIWDHTLDVPMPDVEAPITSIVPSAGAWVCTATATNIVGESGEATAVPFVALESVPGAPTGLVVVP